MKIKSKDVTLSNVSSESVFEFLSKPVNIEHLLPKNQISDWKFSETDCSFKVQNGVVTISLIADGGEKPNKIIYKSGEKSPFPFKLSIIINESNGNTSGYLEFDGEVNMFLKIMVEKPLTNLFNDMADELHKHFAS
jgi:carbon monoxide dehydrogenase subunit G